MASADTPEVGDKVSWQHGGSAPGGEIVEKKTEGEIAIQSKRGNTIKAKGSHDDPAVHLARSGNDVVKKQSALEVEEKGSGSATDGAKAKGEESKADEDKGLANGETAPKSAKKGEKRKAEEDAGEETPVKKSRGRPKQDKTETAAKEKKTPKKAAEKKEKTPKKAASADGEKKPRGRPKKDGSASAKGSGVKKTKKAKAPPVKGSVGTRTRSAK